MTVHGDGSAMREEELETAIKVVVVGNGAVGKSSMIQRYCKGIFTKDYKKTIGVDFLERQIEWVVIQAVYLTKSNTILFEKHVKLLQQTAVFCYNFQPENSFFLAMPSSVSHMVPCPESLSYDSLVYTWQRVQSPTSWPGCHGRAWALGTPSGACGDIKQIPQVLTATYWTINANLTTVLPVYLIFVCHWWMNH